MSNVIERARDGLNDEDFEREYPETFAALRDLLAIVERNEKMLGLFVRVEANTKVIGPGWYCSDMVLQYHEMYDWLRSCAAAKEARKANG